jgi:phospholipase C
VPIYTTNPDGTIADPIGNWKAAIQTEGTLPQVIFIERGGCTVNTTPPPACTDTGVTGTDEHPGANILVGANDTANIINALMQSPSWNSSVFILVFDEGGGTYDHVLAPGAPAPDSIPPSLPTTASPGKYTFKQTGFRVPNIIVSPWVRPQFVSHTVRDTTAILRLIESRFGLQALSLRDAAWDDMREFFDFTSPHLQTPPPLPNPVTPPGNCNFNQETPP